MSSPEKPLDGNSVPVVLSTQVKFGARVSSDSHRAADLEETEQAFIVVCVWCTK